MATVAGRAALMDPSVPEVICLRSFLMPPQARPILPRVCERLIGDAALRSVLIVLLPSLVPAAEASPVPTGYALFKLPVGEFRAYVAGIVEGQMLLAGALNVLPAVCVDPMCSVSGILPEVCQDIWRSLHTCRGGRVCIRWPSQPVFCPLDNGFSDGYGLLILGIGNGFLETGIAGTCGVVGKFLGSPYGVRNAFPVGFEDRQQA